MAVVWFALWFARGFVEPLKEGRNPHETLMSEAARVTGRAELVLINWREGHWLFARQPLVHFGFTGQPKADAAAYWLRHNPAAFALIPATELGRCFNADKARKLGDTSRAEWYVVGADADNGQCQGAAPNHVYRFAWAKALAD